jgi:uncharacterized repeat protein (TIGR03803 family)
MLHRILSDTSHPTTHTDQPSCRAAVMNSAAPTKAWTTSSISNARLRFTSTKFAAAISGAFLLAMLSALLFVAAPPAQAQVETMLYSFPESYDCCGGPAASLITDGSGNFYGTTQGSGTYGNGSVFAVSPNGSEYEYNLYSFCPSAPTCTDGSDPVYSGVIRDTSGNLYGTTAFGGANGCGVVYELSPSGVNWTEKVLFSFPPAPATGNDNNCTPLYGVIMDKAGNLYGTTSYGVVSQTGTTGHGGAVFELSQSAGVWTEKILYSYPYGSFSGVTMDAAGNLYGIGGDGNSVAYLVELSPNGKGGWSETTIYAFNDYKDGSTPESTPVLDAAGNIYGSTSGGGADHSGVVYEVVKGQGTWTYHVLYSFNGTTGGGSPFGGVILNSAGDIFGTTQYGGTNSDGTVYALGRISPGVYGEKVLVNFDGANGNNSLAGLLLYGGSLYGTTEQGGAYSAGSVFQVSQ